jgi:gamma-glutamylputrescine oxidase
VSSNIAKHSSEYPNSYYFSTKNRSVELGSLNESLSCDVCIIGAGYTGLSSALHLSERGYDVVVLEAHQVAWGASGRNGGQLGSGQRKEQPELEKMMGAADARKLWDLAEEAKNTARSLIATHNIDCDLKHGVAQPNHREKYDRDSKEEVEILNERYDYDQISYLDRQQMRDLVGSGTYFGGTLDVGASHLHPLNYALGLAAAAVKAGARIFEHSPVESYVEGAINQVKTQKHTVKAKSVIVACNGYLGALERRMAGKIMPINNFILATEPLAQSVVDEINPKDIAFADSRFVVNYYRLSADKRLLFGGGENYSPNFPKDLASFVQKPMLQVYPQLKETRIDFAWGGTLAVTLNRMPHFGRIGKSNIYFAQGYSGHGVAMATLAGKLLAEGLAGEQERFELMSKVPTPPFPGGAMLRYPGLVLGMMYYAFRDRF